MTERSTTLVMGSDAVADLDDAPVARVREVATAQHQANTQRTACTCAVYSSTNSPLCPVHR